MRGDPFSLAEQSVLRDMLEFLLGLDDVHGGWTSKIDARQTGFSLHIKFEKKADATLAVRAASVFDQAPVAVYTLIDRVLGQIEAAAAVSEAAS